MIHLPFLLVLTSFCTACGTIVTVMLAAPCWHPAVIAPLHNPFIGLSLCIHACLRSCDCRGYKHVLCGVLTCQAFSTFLTSRFRTPPRMQVRGHHPHGRGLWLELLRIRHCAERVLLWLPLDAAAQRISLIQVRELRPCVGQGALIWEAGGQGALSTAFPSRLSPATVA